MGNGKRIITKKPEKAKLTLKPKPFKPKIVGKNKCSLPPQYQPCRCKTTQNRKCGHLFVGKSKCTYPPMYQPCYCKYSKNKKCFDKNGKRIITPKPVKRPMVGTNKCTYPPMYQPCYCKYSKNKKCFTKNGLRIRTKKPKKLVKVTVKPKP